MKAIQSFPAYWLREPFYLLDSERNRVSLVLFCGLFSFLFLYIFSPFNINSWYQGDPLTAEAVLLIFSLCGMAALWISQLLLVKLKRSRPLSNYHYFFWFLGEALLVTLFVCLVNVWIHRELSLSWKEFRDTMKFSFPVLGFSYSLALLWFYSRETAIRLRELQADQPKLAKEESVHPDSLSIRDESGRVVISIDLQHLLFLKSEGNYVCAYYHTGSVIKKELVRTTLKKLEGDFLSRGIIRIHRSYLVNAAKVLLFRKNAKGNYIQIKGLEGQNIPVSPAYLGYFEDFGTGGNG